MGHGGGSRGLLKSGEQFIGLDALQKAKGKDARTGKPFLRANVDRGYSRSRGPEYSGHSIPTNSSSHYRRQDGPNLLLLLGRGASVERAAKGLSWGLTFQRRAPALLFGGLVCRLCSCTIDVAVAAARRSGTLREVNEQRIIIGAFPRKACLIWVKLEGTFSLPGEYLGYL
jgi:hypothetical protein